MSLFSVTTAELDSTPTTQEGVGFLNTLAVDPPSSTYPAANSSSPKPAKINGRTLAGIIAVNGIAGTGYQFIFVGSLFPLTALQIFDTFTINGDGGFHVELDAEDFVGPGIAAYPDGGATYYFIETEPSELWGVGTYSTSATNAIDSSTGGVIEEDPMLSVYQQTVVDEEGNIISGAVVTVRDANTATLVPLYEDEAGTTSAGNPISTDANGFFRIYVQPGKYQINAVLDDFNQTLENVLIGACYAIIAEGPAYVAVDPGVTTQLDDFDVDESTKFVDFDTVNTLTLTGMVPSFDGQEVTIGTRREFTEGSGTMVFIMAEDEDSEAQNRFQIAGNLTILQYMSFTFIYCAAVQRWRLK